MLEPGAIWLDTDGAPIQAHGGGVLYRNGTYYWYGENKNAENVADPAGTGAFLDRVDVIGVSCYSSQDLLHWKNEGVVLPAVADDPAQDLHSGKVAERPKVLYNVQTGKYVLWLHIDTADYKYARTGVAVSDQPTGPFEYLGSFRPNGAESRDMTLFQDEDGVAYLIYSAEWNATTYIAPLTDDYLSTRGEFVRVFEQQYREAPAVFKHEDQYFMVTSGCSGWAPNEAQYAVAPTVQRPWTVMGNPCVGPDADKTFHAQSTFVLPVAGKAPGSFIFMADRWNNKNLRDSRYVWLPMQIEDDRLTIHWRDRWDLSEFEQRL